MNTITTSSNSSNQSDKITVISIDELNVDKFCNSEGIIDLGQYVNLMELNISIENPNNNLKIINYPEKIEIITSKGQIDMGLNNLPENVKRIFYYGLFSILNYEDFTGLPNKLEKLHCVFCQLTKLDNLPTNLKSLNCNYNKIELLDNLPESLIKLNCKYNKLKNLDNLPNRLEYLDCSFNELIKLNCLPDSITHLYCKNNNIISIEKLPTSLSRANFTNNPLISKPKCSKTILLLNYSLDAEKANVSDKIVNAGYKFAYGTYIGTKYTCYGLGYTALATIELMSIPFIFAYQELKKKLTYKS